jgi:hypothetical protein
VDVQAIREHVVFRSAGWIMTGNAASTQPARELLALTIHPCCAGWPVTA